MRMRGVGLEGGRVRGSVQRNHIVRPLASSPPPYFAKPTLLPFHPHRPKYKYDAAPLTGDI